MLSRRGSTKYCHGRAKHCSLPALGMMMRLVWTIVFLQLESVSRCPLARRYWLETISPGSNVPQIPHYCGAALAAANMQQYPCRRPFPTTGGATNPRKYSQSNISGLWILVLLSTIRYPHPSRSISKLSATLTRCNCYGVELILPRLQKQRGLG